MDAADYDPDSAKDITLDEDEEGSYVTTTDKSCVEWPFEVETSGLYSVKITYLPIEGKNADIERALTVNGEVPFKEAQYLNFSRIWTNEQTEETGPNGIKQDPRGNDVKPRQIEVPQWRETYVRDSYGYYQEPLLFYFEKGKNTLGFEGVRESMGIRNIVIGEAENIPSYDAYLQKLDEEGIAPTYKLKDNIVIQGEDARLKSHSTLYPVSDRSSPRTVPYDASKLRLNTIGGYNWRQSGQWITWDVKIPEDGFYNLAIKYRQQEATGLTVSRKLLIDGDASSMPVTSSVLLMISWKLHAGGDDPYSIYLEKGPQRSRRRGGTRDELSHTLQKVDASPALNEIYRIADGYWDVA